MKAVSAPPSVSLMHSMRSVGYSLEASVADLVDNSLAAGANTVSILTGKHPEPYLAILDDGSGMTSEILIQAMTLGSKDPGAAREEDDLGRFGLGLKTATFAHAKTLRVISKREGVVVGAMWDLNQLHDTSSWDLWLLDEAECHAVPGFSRLHSQPSGTLVVWTNLDQILHAAGDLDAGFDEALATTRDHLGLVFHRFIDGDARRVYIDLNGNTVEAADPFLKNHRKTMPGPPERIEVEGEVVTFRAFTLPIPSSLSAAERERARVRNGLRDTQGFYIYRGKRLVVAGSWFNLRPRQELDKLTRVQMDIPNSLDHLWQLDVKKSTAKPPAAVRQKVRHLMDRATEPSRRAFRYRGRQAKQEDIVRVWNVMEDRDSFRYEINEDHPLLRELLDGVQGSQIRALIRVIEQTAPWEDAYTRHTQDQALERATVDVEALALQAKELATLLNQTEPRALAALLRPIEPFSSLPPATLTQISQEALKS